MPVPLDIFFEREGVGEAVKAREGARVHGLRLCFRGLLEREGV